MTMTMFTRFVNIRNMMNVNNFSLFGNESNGIQCSSILCKLYSTTNDNTILDNTEQSSKRISKAMKVYLQQAKEYNDFIQKEIAEYNIGKRHLANMMGEDINNFSEQDVNRAIKYLFPSGLYDPEARPKLATPDKLYASRKKAEFDESGRPYHFLFYTTRPNYYNILHKIAESMIKLNKIEDERNARMNLATPEDKIRLEGSEWIKKHTLESRLLEQLTDPQYNYLLTSLQRLTDHPFSNHVSSFVKDYMIEIKASVVSTKIPKLEYDEKNRPYVVIQNCSRKSARGDVKVIGHGSGKITINGEDILYFENIQCREQVIFPLIFTEMSDKVDVEATVSGGGPTGQSGLIRLGIAKGLQSFVSDEMIEKMRIAGLLTHDPRTRERKKFGQEGARRKFAWKKR